jgi:folate-dependent phosphoribosylglycinamide formyltransferase PurN
MKIVLLTSDSYRHKYIAHQLSKLFNLDLIITEKKSSKIQNISGLSLVDSDFVKAHFLFREKSEIKFFETYENFPDARTIQLNHNEINNEDVFNIIKEVNPRLIILFGTSIIKDPLLSYFESKIINLHLGLSPYYKGSATNLFPFLYDDFAAIGATIHLATSKVDDGPILHQIRPDIKSDDSIHDIGNKVIFKSGVQLPKLIQRFLNKEIEAQLFQGEGKICKNKDLTIDALRKIYSNFTKEKIEDFLINYDTRCNEKPIIKNT